MYVIWLPYMTNRALSLEPSKQLTDPNEFYVSPPQRGGGCPVAGRVEAAMKGRISHVVQLGHLFTSESDFVRAAVHWFMEEKIAPKMGGQFIADMKLASLQVHTAQLSARLQRATKFYEDNKRALLDLAAEEAWDQAVDLWNEIQYTIESMGEPFRSKAKRLFEADNQVRHIKRRADERNEVQAA